MKIGEDYDKIEFSVFNLDLLEPNSLISDTLIAVTGLICAVLIIKNNKRITNTFFNNWKKLFLLYSITFFLGGLAHVFFNYWGVPGKYIPLVIGLGIPYFIEHAMISLLPNQKTLLLISKIKLGIAFIALTLIALLASEDKVLSAMLLVPSLNSFIGLTFSCGYLGWKFSKTHARSFRLLPITVLILVPAAIVQALKISFHPWFDRNDFSHLLIVTSLILYYYAIQGYRNELLSEHNH